MRGITPNPTAANEARVNQLDSTPSRRLYRPSRYLPEDLLPNILSRLPVKSILRFRSVSKGWLAVVDDAEFPQLHLNNFKNNRDETNLLVLETQTECALRCADTFEPLPETSLIFGVHESNPKKCWSIVNSVDGLVLLTLGGNILKLWNPSLRQFYEVPRIPEIDLGNEIIGFGYDPLAKNYKICSAAVNWGGFGSKYAVSPSVAIYTIGDYSWKIIPFRSNDSSTFVKIISPRPVYLQGSLYFVTMDEYNSVFLTSFDLSNMVFSRISIPDDINDRSKGNLLLLLVDGGSSVAMHEFSNINSIWVLERETMNWKKRCLLSERSCGALYSKKNNDMLIYCENHPSHDSVASYNFEEHEYKILQPNTSVMHIFAYVESLILNKLFRV